MFQPKFGIGDVVCSKEFNIDKGIIVGVKVYHESSHYSKSTFISSNQYLELCNNCDYDIVYDDKNGNRQFDCLSEKFLEEYVGGVIIE